MPRAKRKSKASKPTTKRCKWCNTTRDGRGFERHQRYCKQIHERHRRDSAESSDDEEMSVDGVDSAEDDLHPEYVSSSVLHSAFIGPLLPGAYFRIFPHPHSVHSTPQIIPLADYGGHAPDTPTTSQSFGRAPWFPFKTRADFEVSEISVKGVLNKDLTDSLLAGAKTWSKGHTEVTLQNQKEMRSVLESASKYGVKFKEGSISATYKGKTYNVKFEYRDPWTWINTLLEDETLGHMIYNSVRKYYCEGARSETLRVRVIDEPNTADSWENFESELPDSDVFPHCLLPLHFWLDEGMVTKRITMHPMVLRAVFLPGDIRNASGNGGGVLVGYMSHIEEPGDPSDRKTAETLEFAKFKMKIYQRILAQIFSGLRSRSWNGEPIRCCDKHTRIFHPGIHINSLDGKEASYFNACRAALANHPCPKCLVHKCDLHQISSTFKLRTSETMQAVVRKALNAATKADKERILKKNGLHGIHHFLWGFRFSDPYAAYSFDTLHSDDLGKWGHHIWPLLLDILKGMKQKALGKLAENMREFARWPDLKHFNQVTTVHFTDGESFSHILKRVSEEYGKDFDFFKQHACSHVVKDIHDKGTTNHGSTRPGEGFQQEAAEAYQQTNCKEVAPQMDRIDERQESIARIRMLVDDYDKEHRREAEEEVDIKETKGAVNPSAAWKFGAPERRTNSRAFEQDSGSTLQPFPNFDLALRDFIAEHFPEDLVQPYKLAYVLYQSVEDWRRRRDIIRCSPSFHSRPRYDCLLYSSDRPGMAFARARAFLRCNMATGRQIDLVLVNMFSRSKWKPNTLWDGCQVHEEGKEYEILLMDYVVRGALLTPARDSGKPDLHFLVDTVDADMFLRADGID
ncbi:hypothetical protein C8J57DRAFT_1436238 [Mycena rebaudengoi]|nr:hypothetical protein C8J57DRAFT_1436238 [Mycena rebaudengoi]